MPVDAAQIAAPQRHAMTIEKFQYPDCNLAAIVQPVAELRGDELSGGSVLTHVDDDPDHFRHRRAQEEVVERDLIDPSHAPEQF